MTSFFNVESLKTISKKEVPAGNRLARIIFKDVKRNGVVVETKDSKGLWVNAITDNMLAVISTQPAGAEYLRGCIAGVQDGIIRSLIEKGKVTISEDEIDYQRILQAMAIINESGADRFSKESIASWFNSVLLAPLSAAIKAKMDGISDSQLNKLLNNYLESFQILAGRNPSMNNNVKAGLIRALEFMPEDHESATALEIVRRLNDVQEASVTLAAL